MDRVCRDAHHPYSDRQRHRLHQFATQQCRVAAGLRRHDRGLGQGARSARQGNRGAQPASHRTCGGACSAAGHGRRGTGPGQARRTSTRHRQEGVPDTILLKPGKLIEEEREQMRRYATYTYELLSPIEFLRPALNIPYCHHEKWDGNGYPRVLKKEQIPLAARILGWSTFGTLCARIALTEPPGPRRKL